MPSRRARSSAEIGEDQFRRQASQGIQRDLGLDVDHEADRAEFVQDFHALTQPGA